MRKTVEEQSKRRNDKTKKHIIKDKFTIVKEKILNLKLNRKNIIVLMVCLAVVIILRWV